eukprot:tig00000459_g1126.t1
MTDDVRLRFELKASSQARDVFISYAHKPPEIAEFATRLRDALEARHLSCWLDQMKPSGIAAGTEWRQEIGRGIRASCAVVFVASTHSCSSEWCKRELALARALGRPILPVWRELVPLDEEMKSYLWKTQFADFTKDAGFQPALDSLASTLGDIVGREKAARDAAEASEAAGAAAGGPGGVHVGEEEEERRAAEGAPIVDPTRDGDDAPPFLVVCHAGSSLRVALLAGLPLFPALLAELGGGAEADALAYSLARAPSLSFTDLFGFPRDLDRLVEEIRRGAPAAARPGGEPVVAAAPLARPAGPGAPAAGGHGSAAVAGAAGTAGGADEAASLRAEVERLRRQVAQLRAENSALRSASAASSSGPAPAAAAPAAAPRSAPGLAAKTAGGGMKPGERRQSDGGAPVATSTSTSSSKTSVCSVQ